MKIIFNLSIRIAMLIYIMNWPNHLKGNVFSMMAIRQLDLYGDVDIRNCMMNPETTNRNNQCSIIMNSIRII